MEPAEAVRCAAPAWLLAQDCLERFEALGPALDWCCERPGGGGGALLLADAGGRLDKAVVESFLRNWEIVEQTYDSSASHRDI